MTTEERKKEMDVQPRLIDESKTMLAVQKALIELGFEPLGHHAICIFESIESVPTAYDVENVVAELEKKKKEYLEGFRTHNNNEMYGIACGFGDSIKIVKRGGVDVSK